MVHSPTQHSDLDVKGANFSMVARRGAAAVEMHGSYYPKEISRLEYVHGPLSRVVQDAQKKH